MTLDEYLRKRGAERDREAYEFMLSDKRGRWFLAHLMAGNHIFTTTFTGNSDTFRREGARNVVLTINDNIRQMGETAIDSLLLAEGEYHKWVYNETQIYKGGRKHGQREHE